MLDRRQRQCGKWGHMGRDWTAIDRLFRKEELGLNGITGKSPVV